MIIDNKYVKQASTLLFWLGIMLELTVSFSGFAYGGYHEPVIIVAAMGCFSLKILLDIDFKSLRRVLPLYVVAFGYALACYYFQGSALVLRIVLLIIAGRDKNARDVIRVFFYGTCVVMLVTGLMSVLGIYGQLCVTDLFRHVPETRYCFGFFNPNGFALFLVRVFIMGIYLYGARLKWWGYLAVAIVVIPLLILVNSKMAYVTVAIIVLVSMLINRSTKKAYGSSLMKLVYVGGLLAMISEIASIVIYCANYVNIDKVIRNENNIWYYINALTSGRLYNAASVWHEVRPTLMGVKVLENGTEIGFFNAMYGQGIVFILMYLVVQFGLYIRCYKRQEYYSMLLVLGFALYSMAEAFIPYANKNGVWMLLIGMVAGGWQYKSSREAD